MFEKKYQIKNQSMKEKNKIIVAKNKQTKKKWKYQQNKKKIKYQKKKKIKV